MKKTLIAAGIAAVVAAPAAFADVKISGQVLQVFEFIENGDMTSSRDNAVSFKASEDLGNGLSAFATLVIDFDKTEDGDASSTKDEVVGLKGSFGTIVAGRMEDFTESKIHGKMTLMTANGGSTDNHATGAGVEAMLPSPASRNAGAIAYISPTMNGLHFGVASYADDATDMALFYDNGPLSLAVAHEIQKASGPDNTTAATTQDQKTTSFAASYSMGDLKGTVVHVKQDNDAGTAANDIDGTAYRLDYKMGNNAISLVYGEKETGAGADDGDATAIEVVHNFSKQTAIGASYFMRDNVSTADNDVFAVGLRHKF